MDARTGTLRGAAKHIIHPVHLTWFFSPSRRRACKTHCTANRTYRSGAARMPSATTATANWPAGKFRDSLMHWAARHPMFYRTPFKRSRNTILANSCGWNTLRRLNHEAAPRIHLPRPSVIRPRRSSACMRTAAQNVNRPKHGVPARFGRRSPGNRKVSRVAVTRARASLAHRDHLRRRRAVGVAVALRIGQLVGAVHRDAVVAAHRPDRAGRADPGAGLAGERQNDLLGANERGHPFDTTDCVDGSLRLVTDVTATVSACAPVAAKKPVAASSASSVFISCFMHDLP